MLSYELYEKIVQYIESKITVGQLEDWLIPRLPGIMESPDSVDADATSAIELGLAEMGDGIRTEDEFRQLLLGVIEKYPMVILGPPQVVTSSVNQTIWV